MWFHASISIKTRILIFLLLIAFPIFLAAENINLPYRAKVIQIVDGETFRVDTGLRIELQGIRLITGKETLAKKTLEEMIFGKEVTLEYDSRKPDRFGRIFAYVFLGDNVFVNRTLIEKGLAEVGDIPENSSYKNRLMGIKEEPSMDEGERMQREMVGRMGRQMIWMWGILIVALIVGVYVRRRFK